MDIAPLTTDIPVEAIESLKRLKSLYLDGTSDPHTITQMDFDTQQKIKLAKNFESILLTRLLEEMKNTIVDWGNEHDGMSEQIQGIFWLYLAQDSADKGGLGLWRDIYQHFEDLESGHSAGDSLDSRL